MKQEFAPYDRTLKLKELGFDEPCISYYTAYGNFSNDYSAPRKYNSEFELGSYISAPTFGQAFRWFRENYNLTWEHQFDDSNISLYAGEIAYPDNNLDFVKIVEVEYDSYNKAFEAAELAALDKLIELVEIKHQEQ